MAKFKDLTGQVFGRLTVISIGEKSGVSTRFVCKCECGTIKTYYSSNLRRGLTTSCGCIRAEVTAARNTTHGLRYTSTYEIWSGMHKRCRNANDANYPRYGGRGITVCDRWLSFEAFVLDMGLRPDGQSLDRANNAGNYEPDNCRWATKSTQANNTRTNRFVTFNGETKTVAEWAEQTGLKRELITNRIDRGWSVERTLTTPPIEKFRNHAHNSSSVSIGAGSQTHTLMSRSCTDGCSSRTTAPHSGQV